MKWCGIGREDEGRGGKEREWKRKGEEKERGYGGKVRGGGEGWSEKGREREVEWEETKGRRRLWAKTQKARERN